MAKKSAAPTRARTEPETIPLRDVTITWPYQSPWMNEPKMTTITGEQLAGVLNIIGGRVGQSRDQREAGVDIISYRLEGLSSILGAVGDSSDLADYPDRLEPIFDTLSDYVQYHWTDLRQGDEQFVAEKVLKHATVTITPAAEQAVA
jgi:hypothetical protein